MAATTADKATQLSQTPAGAGTNSVTPMLPDSSATIANFRASDVNLAGAGYIGVVLDGSTNYCVPVLRIA